MPVRLERVDLLPQEIARIVSVPVERIEHIIVVAQYDTGIAMLHTTCCNQHAREFLAILAATPPDVEDVGRFTGSN